MDPRQWSFDIDRYLNRLVPPPPWNYVPYPVARFLGYRTEEDKPKHKGNLAPIFWAFIGIWCGVAVIEVVDMHVPAFQARNAPLIVGSFVSSFPCFRSMYTDDEKGAAAVLEFYAIESPLAQPRNAIFGQLISCIVGVAVCKLFLLSDNFDSIRWSGGALACAAATAIMALTKTVHPPAGATALLAVTDDNIVSLGWFLIPMVMLGCSLMLAVALIINNLGRRFPLYWWTPEDLGRKKRDMSHHSNSSNKNSLQVQEDEGDKDVEAGAGTGGEHAAVEEAKEVILRPGEVSVPSYMHITPEEMLLLEQMSQRL